MKNKNKYPHPLPGFVLVELPEKEQIGGFVVARDPKDKRTWAREGKVIAIGWPIFIDDREISRLEFKVGSVVYFSSFTDHPISNRLTLIKYSEILAVKHA